MNNLVFSEIYTHPCAVDYNGLPYEFVKVEADTNGGIFVAFYLDKKDIDPIRVSFEKLDAADSELHEAIYNSYAASIDTSHTDVLLIDDNTDVLLIDDNTDVLPIGDNIVAAANQVKYYCRVFTYTALCVSVLGGFYPLCAIDTDNKGNFFAAFYKHIKDENPVCMPIEELPQNGSCFLFLEACAKTCELNYDFKFTKPRENYGLFKFNSRELNDAIDNIQLLNKGNGGFITRDEGYIIDFTNNIIELRSIHLDCVMPVGFTFCAGDIQFPVFCHDPNFFIEMFHNALKQIRPQMVVIDIDYENYSFTIFTEKAAYCLPFDKWTDMRTKLLLCSSDLDSQKPSLFLDINQNTVLSKLSKEFQDVIFYASDERVIFKNLNSLFFYPCRSVHCTENLCFSKSDFSRICNFISEFFVLDKNNTDTLFPVYIYGGVNEKRYVYMRSGNVSICFGYHGLIDTDSTSGAKKLPPLSTFEMYLRNRKEFAFRTTTNALLDLQKISLHYVKEFNLKGNGCELVTIDENGTANFSFGTYGQINNYNVSATHNKIALNTRGANEVPNYKIAGCSVKKKKNHNSRKNFLTHEKFKLFGAGVGIKEMLAYLTGEGDSSHVQKFLKANSDYKYLPTLLGKDYETHRKEWIVKASEPSAINLECVVKAYIMKKYLNEMVAKNLPISEKLESEIAELNELMNANWAYFEGSETSIMGCDEWGNKIPIWRNNVEILGEITDIFERNKNLPKTFLNLKSLDFQENYLDDFRFKNSCAAKKENNKIYLDRSLAGFEERGEFNLLQDFMAGLVKNTDAEKNPNLLKHRELFEESKKIAKKIESYTGTMAALKKCVAECEPYSHSSTCAHNCLLHISNVNLLKEKEKELAKNNKIIADWEKELADSNRYLEGENIEYVFEQYNKLSCIEICQPASKNQFLAIKNKMGKRTAKGEYVTSKRKTHKIISELHREYDFSQKNLQKSFPASAQKKIVPQHFFLPLSLIKLPAPKKGMEAFNYANISYFKDDNGRDCLDISYQSSENGVPTSRFITMLNQSNPNEKNRYFCKGIEVQKITL
jgi:hypothetical protein